MNGILNVIKNRILNRYDYVCEYCDRLYEKEDVKDYEKHVENCVMLNERTNV